MSKLKLTIMEEVNQEEKFLEYRRLYQLSTKSCGVVYFLSIVMAFSSYLYTRRWGALGIFGGVCIVLGSLFTPEEEVIPPLPVLLFCSLWAGVDNSRAIIQARERWQALEEDLTEGPHDGSAIT